MKPEKAPSFQFYPKDFLTDVKVMVMSLEVRGIYINLLCFDWLDDGIPETPSTWLKIGGYAPFDDEGDIKDEMTEVIAQLSSCFIAHPSKPGYVTNPRLMKERRKQEEFRRSKASAGKKGAKRRWENDDSKAIAEAWQSDSKTIAKNASSSSSSSSNKDKDLAESRFAQFWASYPRHEKKKDAFRAFIKAGLGQQGTDALWQQVLSAIETHRNSDQWTKDDGRFIPHPASWLNGHRWEDELQAAAVTAGEDSWKIARPAAKN